MTLLFFLCFFLTWMIILIASSFFPFKNKMKFFKAVFELIKSTYSSLFKENSKCISCMIIIGGICTIALLWIVSYERYYLMEGKQNIMKALIIWGLFVLLIYFALTILLITVRKTFEIIGEIADNTLSIHLTMSLLMTGILLCFSCLVEEEIKKNLCIMIVELIICYFLNLHVLFKIIRNPFCCISKKGKLSNKNRSVVIFTWIMIVMLIILNLYLIVLWTYFKYDGAYSLKSTLTAKWDLLYYTIISFTTIGYGDITPNIVISQFVSIIISITSVICLIIFISSVLSVKNELTENE